MKKAYQYLRISQEDQSHFSITGQQRFNESFAKRFNCNIVRTFIDDGRSAKDFNRPEWKKLEKEIYHNRRQIDYLIISKYDRLIRNVREGLVFLEKIENKWGIRVISAMEDYFSHPDDPMFVRDRTQRLLDAEVERLRISDRVKFGNWQAKNEGRYIGIAPFGYRNDRDESDKPIILMNKNEAEVVRFIFEQFNSGVPIATIKDIARKKGLSHRGNSAIQRILSNATYAGFIEVKPYRDHKFQLVRGNHDPIISEQTYYIAQNILQQEQRGQVTIIREELPLRGYINCPSCNQPYTGARSKGRSKYYWYYSCNRCNGTNLSANIAHGLLDATLSKIEITDQYEKFIKLKSKFLTEQYENRRENEKKVHLKKIQTLKKKIESVEEKFINDDINATLYKKYKGRYQLEIQDLESKINSPNLLTGIDNHIDDLFSIISDISGFYTQLSTAGKQLFFSGLFGRGSIISRDAIEPLFIHPVLKDKIMEIKELKVKENPDLSEEIRVVPVGSP